MDDYELDSSDQSTEFAKKNGLVVNVDNGLLVLVDIDSIEQLDIFRDRIVTLSKQLHVEYVEYTRSRNGGLHMYVKLREYRDVEVRLLYSALLGSDPSYILCAWKRHLNKDPHPMILFEAIDAPRCRYSGELEFNIVKPARARQIDL